ncbi:adenylate cyclase, family 3 [Longilinea arvoryzae]|uniref:Adenylate cyclase, family 3 n=1 Tax=Longilinea arvoryzae TaxID=360412 RepID=A0A0S7BBY0_9CHLR|nr:cache domain-containing protein [Longilinea arvoryzae]GAP12272.1 adenylate cyclase, family 3 [Longilinea arvoryzae]
MPRKVLILQSEPKNAVALAGLFRARGDEVWLAKDLDQARSMLGQVLPNLVMMDLHFPGKTWSDFLRDLRRDQPDLNIIMTNTHPDLQREMAVQALGVSVFLRAPFTNQWLDVALRRAEGGLSPNTRPTAGAQAAKPVKKDQAAPRVRMPVRFKITLPYLLLAVILASAAALIISQVMLDSIQDRFLNQLLETGRQSSDWMVREENRMLSTLRLVANTQGVAAAVQSGDAEGLRSLTLPAIVNAGEETVEFLDMQGVSVLGLRPGTSGQAGEYASVRGETIFQPVGFVQAVLQGRSDEQGDKFAGVQDTPFGRYFYVSGPIFDPSGDQVGALLVGKSIHSLATAMSSDTTSQVTIYDLDGQPLSSVLFTDTESFPLARNQVGNVLIQQDQSTLTRDLTISQVGYSELLLPWEVRNGADLGVLGVALEQTFLVRTTQITRLEVFILMVVAILMVIGVGLFLSSLITKPLLKLVHASSEVARGNLEVKVDSGGDDEVAVLAQSFNFMVAGLQEGYIYRDLLGRTVSPEVREQLRQTFGSGNLRLEGQEAVASVLMTDIRGFTTLSEKASPATVFNWLNEYFGRLVPIVVSHGGVVNKFDGDAMLAFFGILPRMLNPRRSAKDACDSAVEMLRAINSLNRERVQRGDPPLLTGIGIHTGVVIAGGLGTSDRLHYTIIGDTVNTSQRLESLTRELFAETGALISQPTLLALGDSQTDYRLEPMGKHSVKGKTEQLMVYRLNELPNLNPQRPGRPI